MKYLNTKDFFKFFLVIALIMVSFLIGRYYSVNQELLQTSITGEFLQFDVQKYNE